MSYNSDVMDFIKDVADANLRRFVDFGCAVAGNNGPYRYEDTNVRNTGHWLIIYTFLWKKYKIESYKVIAERFGDYLIEEQKKSKSGAIKCMLGDKFDHLNGLIGQAWVIEALIYAFNAYGDNKYLECAIKIFNSQEFDNKVGYWQRVELDATNIGYDPTLNHQVWFVIAGLMILKEREIVHIREQVNIFLNRLENDYFGVYPDGLIKHYGVKGRPNKLPLNIRLKIAIKDLCYPMRKINPNKYDSKTQEKGYHLFELYGYAVMKQYIPDYKLYKKAEFMKAVSFAIDTQKLNEMLNISPVLQGKIAPLTGMNRFAYGYNSPAFEYPLVKKMFFSHQNDKAEKELFDIQVKLTYDSEKHMFSKNNYDPETLTARLYECVRYCELF
jgi:hypothetical protein